MHWRVITIGATLLVARCLLTSATSSAQQVAYASIQAESAQDLATRAIACLRRGEDALTQETRMAAFREGLALAERAVTADDRNADAHFAMFANNGRILLEKGAVPNPFNMMETNRELDRTLQLNPNHVDALISKGGIYRKLPRLLGGSLKKAEAYLTRAIELDANAVGGRIELAETYCDMGERERAIPLLETAAEVADRMGKFRQLAEARQLLRELQDSR